MPTQTTEIIEGQPRTGNEDDDLSTALNKAADEVELGGDDKESDDDDAQDDDKKAANKKDEDDGDDEESEEDVTAQQESERALKFYRSITNPETAEQMLTAIAKRAGYELKSLNQQQRDAVTDEIEAVLRAELGDEFTLLPTGLSKALGKIIDGKVKSTRDELDGLKQKISQSEEGLRKAAVDEALSWAAVEYPEFEAKSKRVLKEMKAFPPSPNMNAREYIKKICKLVDIAPKQSVDNSRSNRAQNNKDGSMPSDGVRKERSTKVASSLADAVAMAYEEQFPD